MRDLRSRGYLGELNTRLQRLLGFDGEAGGTFTSEARPVLICGDATMPGYGSASLRRWSTNSNDMGNVGNGQWWYLGATQDVIITHVQFVITAAVAGECAFNIQPRSLPAPAYAIGGVFLDRPVSVSDRPPLINAVAATGAAGKNLSEQYWGAGDYGRVKELIPTGAPFCLSAGTGISVVVSGVGTTIRVTAMGMTL